MDVVQVAGESGVVVVDNQSPEDVHVSGVAEVSAGSDGQGHIKVNVERPVDGDGGSRGNLVVCGYGDSTEDGDCLVLGGGDLIDGVGESSVVCGDVGLGIGNAVVDRIDVASGEGHALGRVGHGDGPVDGQVSGITGVQVGEGGVLGDHVDLADDGHVAGCGDGDACSDGEGVHDGQRSLNCGVVGGDDGRAPIDDCESPAPVVYCRGNGAGDGQVSLVVGLLLFIVVVVRNGDSDSDVADSVENDIVTG